MEYLKQLTRKQALPPPPTFDSSPNFYAPLFGDLSRIPKFESPYDKFYYQIKAEVDTWENIAHNPSAAAPPPPDADWPRLARTPWEAARSKPGSCIHPWDEIFSDYATRCHPCASDRKHPYTWPPTTIQHYEATNGIRRPIDRRTTAFADVWSKYGYGPLADDGCLKTALERHGGYQDPELSIRDLLDGKLVLGSLWSRGELEGLRWDYRACETEAGPAVLLRKEERRIGVWIWWKRVVEGWVRGRWRWLMGTVLVALVSARLLRFRSGGLMAILRVWRPGFVFVR